MKQQKILFILFSLGILVIVWIGFNIYHSSVTSTISETVSTDIALIEASFDVKTIEKLKQREKVIPLFSQQQIATEEAETLPTLIPTPASTSANQPATQSANQNNQL